MRHTRASDKKTEKGLGSRINYNHQNKLTHKQLNNGDVSHKIPVYLSDGKTVVFAKCQEDVERVREFWEEKIKPLF
jgi:hypothetical protein